MSSLSISLVSRVLASLIHSWISVARASAALMSRMIRWDCVFLTLMRLLSMNSICLW